MGGIEKSFSTFSADVRSHTGVNTFMHVETRHMFELLSAVRAGVDARVIEFMLFEVGEMFKQPLADLTTVGTFHVNAFVQPKRGRTFEVFATLGTTVSALTAGVSL